MNSNRTKYDRDMAERYNPFREGYNSPPFPTPRTQFDANQQELMCPSCPVKSIEKYGQDVPSQYRTGYDMEYQKVYGASALRATDYGSSLYKAGFNSKNPPSYRESYKGGFRDEGRYEAGFYGAGFYSSTNPTWETYKKIRENYSASDNLYQDPDIPSSYGLFRN